MTIADLKKIITERLQEMGATDILIENQGDDVVFARFNCKELTSFNKQIPGWVQMGIELNDKKGQDYRIVFLKIVEVEVGSETNPTNKAPAL
jgi:hypothetical protein